MSAPMKIMMNAVTAAEAAAVAGGSAPPPPASHAPDTPRSPTGRAASAATVLGGLANDPTAFVLVFVLSHLRCASISFFVIPTNDNETIETQRHHHRCRPTPSCTTHRHHKLSPRSLPRLPLLPQRFLRMMPNPPQPTQIPRIIPHRPTARLQWVKQPWMRVAVRQTMSGRASSLVTRAMTLPRHNRRHLRSPQSNYKRLRAT